MEIINTMQLLVSEEYHAVPLRVIDVEPHFVPFQAVGLNATIGLECAYLTRFLELQLDIVVGLKEKR